MRENPQAEAYLVAPGIAQAESQHSRSGLVHIENDVSKNVWITEASISSPDLSA
jgi:hypothetical protein